jgi:hypothetical protein
MFSPGSDDARQAKNNTDSRWRYFFHTAAPKNPLNGLF